MSPQDATGGCLPWQGSNSCCLLSKHSPNAGFTPGSEPKVVKTEKQSLSLSKLSEYRGTDTRSYLSAIPSLGRGSLGAVFQEEVVLELRLE